MKKQNGKNAPVDNEKMLRLADTVRAVRVKSALEQIEKEEYIRSRFENIDENDLMDGDDFFRTLDADEEE